MLILAKRARLLWGDLRMSLAVVTALVRNLITVPAAVLCSSVAKDAEVLALRHDGDGPSWGLDQRVPPRRLIERHRCSVHH
ncbi:hypothetical protein ACGF0K_37230 [Streptomyces sp. NPDC048156]|uniref:hypothetical protein n=1 Tax=Streptomyces sp. NPDC048156 TaxID=3365502 RepID=UPI003716561D